MKPKDIKDENTIAYLKGEANYTKVFFNDGNFSIEPCTLKRYEERLEGFIRVSKSHLVNPLYINRLLKKGKQSTVKLYTGSSLLVSRRKRTEVASRLVSTH